MKVILFGSILNPLSAAAAEYLNTENSLKLIVIAKSRCNIQGGFIYLLSQICLGLCRYFHVLLRFIKVKRSRSYRSLLEFIVENPGIPKVYFKGSWAKFEPILNCKLEGLGLDKCLALSCAFPFKISPNLSRIERFINAHPGELPTNRGPNPYFWVLANNLNTSAVTYHILTSQIDSGPVLFGEVFPVNSNFSEYSLEKISVEYLKRSLPVLFERFEEFWTEAKSQGDGVYYPEPKLSDRKKYRRHSLFQMYDFAEDLKRFHNYARKVRSRDSNWLDLYSILTESIAAAGHKRIAGKNELNKIILEIGVGGGEHIRYEEPLVNSKQYYALDIDFSYTKIVKERYPEVKVINADGTYVPFKEKVFDSCIAFGVLEHVRELEKLLLGVKEVVKNGGDFFVVAPANGSLSMNLFKLLVSYPLMYIRGIKKPGRIWNYLNLYNFKEIRRLLSKHFFIEEISSLPFKHIPMSLSPLYFIHCKVA